MKFKIGDTLLDNNVFLAPMAGVTDLPFPAFVPGTGSRHVGN